MHVNTAKPPDSPYIPTQPRTHINMQLVYPQLNGDCDAVSSCVTIVMLSGICGFRSDRRTSSLMTSSWRITHRGVFSHGDKSKVCLLLPIKGSFVLMHIKAFPHLYFLKPSQQILHLANLCLDATFRDRTVPISPGQNEKEETFINASAVFGLSRLAAQPLRVTVKAGTAFQSKTEISIHQAALVLVLLERKEIALALAGAQ